MKTLETAMYLASAAGANLLFGYTATAGVLFGAACCLAGWWIGGVIGRKIAGE